MLWGAGHTLVSIETVFVLIHVVVLVLRLRVRTASGAELSFELVALILVARFVATEIL